MKDKIIIGTAQFGNNYGINNSLGKISRNEAFKMLDYCAENNLNRFDTAQSYGESESILGEYIKSNKIDLKITTKINSNSNNLMYQLDKSLNKLNLDSIYELLFHSITDYKFYKDQLCLESIQKNKLFDNCGVSLYSNNEIMEILQEKNINSVQFPFNLLDNLNERRIIIEKLREKNYHITFRSIFLQGLFFMNKNKIPNHLKPLKPLLEEITSLIAKYKLDLKQVAISYCINQNPKGVIIGFDSLKQLKEIVCSLNQIQGHKIFKEIEKIKLPNKKLIDPRYW